MMIMIVMDHKHLSYQIQSHQISLSLTINRYGTIRVIAAAETESVRFKDRIR